MDAFAASIGKGAALHKPRFREAFRTGLIFGVVEAITPLIGWGIGLLASKFIMEWDHWVAFALLFVLGSRMVYEGWKGNHDENAEPVRRHGFLAARHHGDCNQLGCDGYRRRISLPTG
ncbi:putative membrane protein [Obesumbacterium proteus ATCC 12841]|uniref:Membrane protein n=1 Tax=Obesumbacterium proteus ATCC 12841 TaxID=1354268 RepID=A0AA91EES5_9GAMM|nr:putative membrane protein [Obesumbacterium proteus ATCC 12841]